MRSNRKHDRRTLKKGLYNIDQCDCIRCQLGDAAYEKHVEQVMKTHGWMTTNLHPACDYPNHTCWVTQGFESKFSHPDLQLCFDLDPKIVHMLFTNAARQLVSGTKFVADGITRYPSIMANGYTVAFKEVIVEGKKMFRMIVPNKMNTFRGEFFENQLL